jgi:rhamnulokinase
MSRTVAAIDLGAESGRVATVTYDGARLELDVVHRFVHTPVSDGDVLRWDLATLWSQIQVGLQMLDARDVTISAVGVDAWGVDYGLLDASGALVDVPTCYRDPRSVRAMHRAIATVGMDALYDSPASRSSRSTQSSRCCPTSPSTPAGWLPPSVC